jgi:hypothetical protein
VLRHQPRYGSSVSWDIWDSSTSKQNHVSSDMKRKGGLCFAERSRGTFRGVILGKLSMRWLRTMVEELISGENLSDFL